VFAVRWRERAVAFNRAAEPGISPARGMDQPGEGGCMNTGFLLMVPTVTETLRRVPDGHPLVTDPKSPLLLGAQRALVVALVIGVIAQVLYLRKQRSGGADATAQRGVSLRHSRG